MCRAGATPFDFARSYGPYAERLRKSIRKFKLEGHRHLAYPLAALLQESLDANEPETRPTWIVPVAAHPGRIRERGFDQVSCLSHALSRRLGVPVFSGLRRVKATRPQPGLNVQERLENVRETFGLSGGEQLAARDVLIVDDVWTTGTTVAEVCRLLRHATGVNKIMVVTLARVSRRYR